MSSPFAYIGALESLRVQKGKAGFAVGKTAQIEEEKERAAEIKRRKRLEKQSAKGRLGGVMTGLIGSILLDAILPGAGTALRPMLLAAGTGVAAGVGSYAGQKAAIGPRKKISPGLFQVAAGKEREKAFKQYRKDIPGARALTDAQTAFQMSLLGNLLGGGGAGAETFPLPEAEASRDIFVNPMLERYSTARMRR